MAAAAVYLALIKHQNDNIGAGILTFYLILTAWPTAKRMLQAGSQEGTLPVTMAFFMGSVLLLAAAGDVRMLLRAAFSAISAS